MIFLDLSFTIALFGWIGTAILMGVQGGLVWLLAYGLARKLRRWSVAAKLVLIFTSWLVWTVGRITVWTLLGGGGGMFEGGIFVLTVIPSGIYGSILAAIAWIAAPVEAEA